MKPTENSSLELHYFGVQDRGAPVTGQDQGGEEVRLIGDTSRDHWRGAASIDYLSSFLFRQAFSETYSQAVNSEVKSVAYLSHNLAGFSLNASASRYQNFYQDPLTNSYSDQIKILHLPMVEVNGLEQHVSSSPLLWGVDASAGGLQRSEPGFVTANLVGRLDLRPRIALPLQWKGWELRPEVAVHDTLYTQQVSSPSATNPLGAASGNEINRRDLEAAIELRPPVLEKVFDREIFGRRLKHVIEPIFTYRYTTGVDNFQNIIRFDQTDILSNTSEFEYDFIQRIYGRRRSTRHEAGCEAAAPPPAGAQGKDSVLHSRSQRGAPALRGREQDHARAAELGGEAEVLHQRELRRRAGDGPPQRVHQYRRPDRHRLPGRAANLESGDQQAAHRRPRPIPTCNGSWITIRCAAASTPAQTLSNIAWASTLSA